MTLNPRTLSIALIAALAVLVVPASAGAEYLVPEGNSAVTQYTEGYPTAGGEKKTEGGKPVTVAKAIGAGNARKLEDHSPDGAAAAELAAETAPQGVAPTDPGTGADNEQGGGQAKNGEVGKPGDSRQAKDASGSGQDEGTSGPAGVAGSDDGPSGSSGLSEVLGAATGSSSGGLGLLLPLVILAAIAWGFAFLWRGHRHSDPAADSRP
jgi:hypothetical protein